MTTDTETEVFLLALAVYPNELYNKEDREMSTEEVVGDIHYILQRFRDSSEINVYTRIGYTDDGKYAKITYVGPIEACLKQALKERGYGDMFNFFNPRRQVDAPDQDTDE